VGQLLLGTPPEELRASKKPGDAILIDRLDRSRKRAGRTGS
jgi:hypothetical protein